MNLEMSLKFCIVDFTEEKAVEVVPDFWICDSYCSWPPRDVNFPTKYVKNRSVPKENWPSFQCRILNTFDDYETARRNLGLAEVTSDFPSEAEITSKRVHKRNKKYYTDSSESNEDNVKSKKHSVPICKSFSQKQFQKNCKPKSTFVLNLSDSEENEISQSTAKDHGSFELQIPKRLQEKSKQIMNTVSAPKSKKDAAIRSLSSLNIYSDQYKEGTSCAVTLYPQHSPENRVVEVNKLADQLIQQIHQAQTSNKIKKPQYVGDSEFEKHVIRDLTMIKFDMRTLVDMITKLSFNKLNTDINEEAVAKQKDEQPEENILPAFPLQHWQNFCDMEHLLHTNDAACRQLEKMLLKRGGKDPADFIRRMLMSVFAPELALGVSWLGRKKNNRLEGTIFARILFAAVKQRYRKIDDREIETTVIDWFRRATDRLKKQANITNAAQ